MCRKLNIDLSQEAKTTNLYHSNNILGYPNRVHTHSQSHNTSKTKYILRETINKMLIKLVEIQCMYSADQSLSPLPPPKFIKVEDKNTIFNAKGKNCLEEC